MLLFALICRLELENRIKPTLFWHLKSEEEGEEASKESRHRRNHKKECHDHLHGGCSFCFSPVKNRQAVHVNGAKKVCAWSSTIWNKISRSQSAFFRARIRARGFRHALAEEDAAHATNGYVQRRMAVQVLLSRE